jgi:hypothetical protein
MQINVHEEKHLERNGIPIIGESRKEVGNNVLPSNIINDGDAKILQ